MPYEKNKLYTQMPFCLETKRAEFYIFYDVEDLADKCEMFKDDSFKFRTIGLLKSINGRFYIESMKLPMNKTTDVRVSMVYMNSYLKSTVIPYPVQLFGTIQWKKEPVIIAHILQALSTSMAIRLMETLKSVSSAHIARLPMEDYCFDFEEDSFSNV
ncbi:PREDICTED: uncharacterized protein LOC106108134 [Papilio polytes]|uniref:uncharacterized protein LOC106108134 n=1 Tax=Papilio polytes TaxID=76194 RepID=UPI000675C097|nr:PREDICTED: uncharacterized protein LOC106108134 [Papilio polytes]